MKEIALTQGKVALVDDHDFDLVSKYKWCAQRNRHYFYAGTAPGGKDRKQIKMHRLIIGATSGQWVDRIDGNTLNNQRSNLRFASARENGCNRAKSKNNTTGFKGIFKKKKRWGVYVGYRWKKIYLGSFKTKEMAAKVYDWAALQFHGKFARTNKQLGLLCQ